MLSRRNFIKTSALGVAALSDLHANATRRITSMPNRIVINEVSANFEREPVIRPFGFKGGFLTEIWQTASQLETESGVKKIGICTQNVLYSDANVFADHSESVGNALMFSLTDRALQMVKQTAFSTPIDLIESILPEMYVSGKEITRRKDLAQLFILNSLIGVDNAAWLVYAAENNIKDFSSMVPEPYRQAVSYKNKKIAILYSVSYGLPLTLLKDAVEQGYFAIKIKLGHPGTQEDMLRQDMDRLSVIHKTIGGFSTSHTKNGKLIYTLDPNARYAKKEALLRLLDHAKKIGAFDQILLIEEPLHENNDEDVSDVGIRIAGDESVHDEKGAVRRLEQGYGALVLKGIAKTLSLSMKLARLAHERNVPCLCADLTVNPILIDWNKNLAARIAPFPGLDMGIIETNGDLNYRNWKTMLTYHPMKGASWTQPQDGIYELDEGFYQSSGGIFDPIPHYEQMFKKF